MNSRNHPCALNMLRPRNHSNKMKM